MDQKPSSMHPLVSALIPTYNQQNFIAETLQSVLDQDYPNIEIVVSDDGSSDNTVAIAEQFRERCPQKFRVITSKHRTGITANCNRLLQNFTGHFGAWLAGDDIWLPSKTSRQVEWFGRNPRGAFLATRSHTFNSNSGRTLFTSPDPELLDRDRDNIIEASFALGSTASSIMFPRWAAPSGGFHLSIPVFSDWLYWIESMQSGEWGCLDEVLIKYRKHSNNTSNNSDQMVTDHLATLAIAEAKFPNLADKIQSKRSQILYAYLKSNYPQTERWHASLLLARLRSRILAALRKRFPS